MSVRRPDASLCNFIAPVTTPDFHIECQNSVACPRDILLVLGSEVIEAPMSLRSRFFEYRPFRPLLWQYFLENKCRWTAAPKPMMGNGLYRVNYPLKDSKERKEVIAKYEYITTELEPVFDAADVLRCGRDVFVQHGQTTNLFGMRWLQRHLGCEYKVHPVHFPADMGPVHIDATFVIPKPGMAIANPERPMTEIGMFQEHGWDIKMAPYSDDGHYGLVSNWISMNCLSIDERTIILEAQETKTIQFFQSLGFRVIPVPFRHCYQFGGSFHCYTVDTRRRGTLQSYFKPTPILEGLERSPANLRPWTSDFSGEIDFF